jgi:hypothetical protein
MIPASFEAISGKVRTWRQALCCAGCRRRCSAASAGWRHWSRQRLHRPPPSPPTATHLLRPHNLCSTVQRGARVVEVDQTGGVVARIVKAGELLPPEAVDLQGCNRVMPDDCWNQDMDAAVSHPLCSSCHEYTASNPTASHLSYPHPAPPPLPRGIRRIHTRRWVRSDSRRPHGCP